MLRPRAFPSLWLSPFWETSPRVGSSLTFCSFTKAAQWADMDVAMEQVGMKPGVVFPKVG